MNQRELDWKKVEQFYETKGLKQKGFARVAEVNATNLNKFIRGSTTHKATATDIASTIAVCVKLNGGLDPDIYKEIVVTFAGKISEKIFEKLIVSIDEANSASGGRVTSHITNTFKKFLSRSQLNQLSSRF